MWKNGQLVILKPNEFQSFETEYFDGVCSTVSAIECEMQAGALSSIMLMNIYMKIKKVIQMFGKQIVNSFVYKV